MEVGVGRLRRWDLRLGSKAVLRWLFKGCTVAIPFVLAACAEAHAPGLGGRVETDSAGVALVESDPGPVLTARAVERLLTIGPEEARPETLFGNVVDVAADDQGRIYVLDQMAREVRVFAQDGTFEGSIGQPGQGPGEFSGFAQSLLVYRDTVLVSDAGNRTIQRFSLSGEFLSSSPQPGSRAARTWWMASDRGLFARALSLATGDDGRWVSEDRILRVDPDGTVDWVAELSYPPTDIGSRGEPKVPYIVNAPLWVPLPDGGVVWTHLETDRLLVHDGEGSLARTIHVSGWQSLAPTTGDIAAMEALMREKLTMLGGDASAVDNLPVVPPTRLPAITGLVGAAGGTLWVQRMGEVRDIHPMALNASEPPVGWGGPVWDVITIEGRHLYQVQLSPRFRLMEIHDDRLYGVQRSELDEETVVVLDLVE